MNQNTKLEETGIKKEMPELNPKESFEKEPIIDVPQEKNNQDNTNQSKVTTDSLLIDSALISDNRKEEKTVIDSQNTNIKKESKVEIVKKLLNSPNTPYELNRELISFWSEEQKNNKV